MQGRGVTVFPYSSKKVLLYVHTVWRKNNSYKLLQSLLQPYRH